MQVRIGSLVKFYTILLLSEEPKHGYDLMKALKKKLDRKISASQTYPFLGILKKNGLVTVEERGERDKKVYKLTSKGREFVNGFMERFGDLIHAAIEPKLSICAHCGCKVYEGGYKTKIGKKEMAFCCHYCANSYKRHA